METAELEYIPIDEPLPVEDPALDEALPHDLAPVDGLSWWDQYHIWLINRGLSEKTIESYLRDLDGFAAWFFRVNDEPFSPEVFNQLDARQYREYSLTTERVAPATWNRRHASLGMFAQWATEELHLSLFDFRGRVAKKDEAQLAPRWLSQADERAVLRQAEINLTLAHTIQQRTRALRDRALLAVMRFGGLRVGEAAAAQIGDLTLRPRSGLLIVHGKGDKDRSVPLSLSAREALQDWLDVRGWDPGPLFCDEDGGPISERAVQKRISALGEQSGVEVTCHMLRHTCAKRIIDAGRPVGEVKDLLGHSKLETTLRYIIPGLDDLQEAVEAGELGKVWRK